MPYFKNSRSADSLLILAWAASVAYVLYNCTMTYLGKDANNVIVAVYVIITLSPRWYTSRGKALRERLTLTSRSRHGLSISLFGFAVVLYLTTKPQIWPAVYAILFVVLPIIISFLLERSKIIHTRDKTIHPYNVS